MLQSYKFKLQSGPLSIKNNILIVIFFFPNSLFFSSQFSLYLEISPFWNLSLVSEPLFLSTVGFSNNSEKMGFTNDQYDLLRQIYDRVVIMQSTLHEMWGIWTPEPKRILRTRHVKPTEEFRRTVGGQSNNEGLC